MTPRHYTSDHDVTSYREGLLFAEIGKMLGMSRQRVQDICAEGLVKLRAVLEEIERIEKERTGV